VTRNFVEQETLLDLADFTTTWTCLQDFPGLVFYNGGKIAGASQKHKHLQLVPFAETDIPITPLLALAKFSHDVGIIPTLPFLHAFAKINITDDIMTIYQKYHTLLEYLGITEIDHQQSAAYNLLATKEWLLIVPRKLEEFATISINSLGFAGCLLVKNPEQMQLLKEIKPMNILSHVAWENK
jgi:ATP adenylyltransferase